MAVNWGHAGTKKGPNWGHVKHLGISWPPSSVNAKQGKRKHDKSTLFLEDRNLLKLRSLALRLLNALNSEDRGLKVRFSLATIVFETLELILCQMLSSQRKNAPSNPYPHYLVRLATSRRLLLSIYNRVWGQWLQTLQMLWSPGYNSLQNLEIL